ncbi:MAG: hypothetical protein ABI237_08290 [Ginsengibacter sp.]
MYRFKINLFTSSFSGLHTSRIKRIYDKQVFAKYQNRNSYHFIKSILILVLGIFLCNGSSYAQYPIQIMTNVLQPVPPYLPQIKADIMGNRSGQLNRDISNHISISLSNTGNTQTHIKLAGSIERISPSPMGVSLRSDFQPSNPIILNPRQMIHLDQNMIQNAFGNFSENSLVYTNTDLATLQQNGLDFKLPEGTYRVCVTAYDYDKAGFAEPLSTPGTGCAYFTICYIASAPQLISPVSTQGQFMASAANLALLQNGKINKNTLSKMGGNGGFQIFTPLTSQIQFAWTPPATTCGLPIGALNYDLEIRQVFNGQTMTDALNNPFVFRQQNIPTTTFLLDTLRYPHVLVSGEKYVIRVKANFMSMPGSPLEIANQGYSQLAALAYQSKMNLVPYSLTIKIDTSKLGNFLTGKTGDSSKSKALPITLGVCTSTSTITNKKALDTTVKLLGKNVTIGAFKMHIDSIQIHKDSSYQGDGYITWSPFGHNLKLKVRFDKIKINSDTTVYFGGVVTSMDNSLPKWERLSNTSNIVDTLSSVDASMNNSDYSQLESYVTDASHLLNKLSGTDEIAFPVGLNNETQGSTFSNTTLAVMGITFTPGGTSMNVLFNLNIPDANGWISMAGSCFQITPGGFSFTNGLLYMPNDRSMTWDGNTFIFKGCKYNNTVNSVDTSKGTYVQWDTSGLKRIMAKADLTLDTTAILPVDSNDKVMVGRADTIHLSFSFTKWDDWMAAITPEHKFEIKSLPGFPISISNGFWYDHSLTRDAPGLSFPAEYVDSPKNGAFEGLFIKDLSMELPSDFKKFTGEKPSFGFHNFIINKDGFTTKIFADNILDLHTGNLGGWAFSIDTLQLGFVKSNPLTEGVKMVGKIKVPISDSDAFKYTCSLNAGTAANGGGLNYLFNIKTIDTIHVNLWKAKLALNPNSSFTIKKDTMGMAIGTLLNGSIGIESTKPKISLTALSFQGMYVGNRDTTGGGSKAGFHFSAGHWSLGDGDTSHPKSTSTAFNNPKAYSFPGSLLGGGPLPPANMGNYAPAGDNSSSSSQSTASSFSLTLSNFTPSFTTKSSSGSGSDITGEYEAGITFNVKVNVGFGDKSLISGDCKLGIFGLIDVSGTESPKVSFEKIQLDSVALRGSVGPVTVNGSLAFLYDDRVYGDGVNGDLQATLPVATLEAGARFGSVHGYHYWAVAGSIYMQSGIQIGPVVFNGFGGGVARNMTIAQVAPDSINGSSSILPQVPLTPAEGHYVFTAQVFLALFRPQTLNANLALSADINTNTDALQAISLDGGGYVFSDNPPTSNPKAIVSVVPMHMIYDFANSRFDATIVGHLNFNKITATAPIWIHVDKDTQYVYVGIPSQRDSIHILTIGTPTDKLYANLDATSYLDAGNVLPAFPGLPTVITHNLPASANPQANSSTIEAMLKQIGTAGNPGFMFGADVNGSLKLSFSFLYASAAATLGFDVALEHINENEIPPGCQQTDGTFGFNNWYAIGQLYAYLSMDVGAHVNTSFYKGDFSLVSMDIGAVLQGGLPNPSWMVGQVHIKGSILGGLVSVDDDYPISIGNQCTVHVNPLDAMQLITDAGPQNNAGVFDKPYAVFSLPMDGRNFPITVPPDNDHNQPYTRTFRFKADQFNLFKITTSGNDSLISCQQDMDPTGKSITLFRNSMLDAHSQYKMSIHCIAQEFRGTSWGDPAEGAVNQDTTLLFTTGDAPSTIVLQNIVSTYPIDGQQYFLKDEFGRKGEIEMGNWQGNLFPSPDLMHGIKSYNYELKFIPENGGDTITTTFVPSESTNSLGFQIPSNLQNSTIYRMEARVLPQFVQINGIMPNSHLNLQQVQKMNTQTQSITTIQRDAKGHLTQTQETKQMNVQLNTQKATGVPQVIHAEIEPIYTCRFRTSQFNNFADKMASFGTLQQTDIGYPGNYSVIKGNSPGAEGFDEFELNGYTNQCTTSANLSGIHSSPMFHAVVPFDYTHASDKYFFDNIYKPLNTLTNETDANGHPKFNVDLGAPEMRDYSNWYYPEYTVSNAMPYATRLGPPAPPSTSNGNNGGGSQSGTGGGKQQVYMTNAGKLGLGITVLKPALLPALPQNNYGGGLAANQRDGHQSSHSSSGQSSNNNTPPPPDPKTINLIWNRLNYINADIKLAQSFSQNFLLAIQNGGYPVNQNGKVLAQGEYGTISINGTYTRSITPGDPAVNVANQLSNVELYGFGDAGNRNINFIYQKTWCLFCGASTVVTKHINVQ